MTYRSAHRQAVILAAGLGSRVRRIKERKPKSLIRMLGTPTLLSALSRLVLAGVVQAAIVVSRRREAIERSYGNSFAGIQNYAESSVVDRTRNAYCLSASTRYALRLDTVLPLRDRRRRAVPAKGAEPGQVESFGLALRRIACVRERCCAVERLFAPEATLDARPRRASVPID